MSDIHAYTIFLRCSNESVEFTTILLIIWMNMEIVSLGVIFR